EGGGANKSKNETHERLLFSEKFACPVSGFTISEIEPRLFSFNNPAGACPTCDGLGSQRAIDAMLVVPDENLTLRNAPSRHGRNPLRPTTRRRWRRWAPPTASRSATSGKTCRRMGDRPS